MGMLSQDQVKMISTMFVFGKVLTVKCLMSPTKLGLGTHFSDQTLLNFRILSSIIYHTFLEYLEGLTEEFTPKS
jgi:hypothetical protein